ncbi:hypothetical protein [Compostibacter hankyongensis]|uniref:DUF4145 domain-containing protein n=1 Tax=Compostibacter hankyongensis TaxID=1007089 RepID=A0ABP8FCN2_9BACT
MHSLPKDLEEMRQELLKEKNKEAAWAIIKEYFQFISIAETKKELWVLTKGALTNDLVEESEEGTTRHDLIFGYEFLILLLEAVHVLYQAKKARAAKKAG